MESLKELINEFKGLNAVNELSGYYDMLEFCHYKDQIIYKRQLYGEVVEIGFGYFIKTRPACRMYLTIRDDLFFVYHRKGAPAQCVAKPKVEAYFMDGYVQSPSKLSVIDRMNREFNEKQ